MPKLNLLTNVLFCYFFTKNICALLYQVLLVRVMARACDEIYTIERAKVHVIVSVRSRVMVVQGLFLGHSHLQTKSEIM